MNATLLTTLRRYRDGTLSADWRAHEGSRLMKAAFAVWDGRMAPVFDVSREALVLTIQDGIVVSRATESIETPMTALKVQRLTELGIGTLVCGAVSEVLAHELSQRGVKVIGFVAGEIEEVVESYLAGKLPNRTLSMPGCCARQRRFRGAGRGRRGGGCGQKERT
jgi:predicted Fe-Mo cluster-binding NifX family protein